MNSSKLDDTFMKFGPKEKLQIYTKFEHFRDRESIKRCKMRLTDII